MNEDSEIFDEPPSFEHLVNRVTSKYGCRADEVEMRGRFDCGKASSHYVLMKLTSEAHWKQYKEIVERSNVVCWEVIVDICRRPTTLGHEEQNVAQNLTQESTISHDVNAFVPSSPMNAPSFDLAVIADQFDNVVFEEEERNQDDDKISLGSEDEDEDDVQGDGIARRVSNLGDVDDDESEEEDEDGIYECPSRPHADVDGLYSYTQNEMRLLKQDDVHRPSVPNDKDISRVDNAVCNSAFILWEGQNESKDLRIHKGMMFDTRQELQFFMADYTVKFHRPFTLVHSDKNLRYDVMCKQGCLWRVWSRRIRSTGKWRVSRVVQPHTCSSLKPKQVYAQCTTKYLSHHIHGIVRMDSDTLFLLLWSPSLPSVRTV